MITTEQRKTLTEIVANSNWGDKKKWTLNYKIDKAAEHGVSIPIGCKTTEAINIEIIDDSLQSVARATGINYRTLCAEMNDAKNIAFPRK